MAELDFRETVDGFVDYRKNPVLVTKVKRAGSVFAYTYQCWLNVDWDGAHKAYGLDRPPEGTEKFPHQQGLEPHERGHRLFTSGRHAQLKYWAGIYAVTAPVAKEILRKNYPNWGQLKPDEQNRVYRQFHDTRKTTPYGSLEDLPNNGKFPIVQLPELQQPFKGYYVSQANATVSRDAYRARPWDQRVYIDAASVPYVVLPKKVKMPGISMGGYGLVIRNKTGAFTPFIFGDSANKEGSIKLGESSGYIFNKLGEGKYNDEPYTFIVFPNTGNGVADNTAVAKMEAEVRGRLQTLASPDNQPARELLTKLSLGQATTFQNIGRALLSLGLNALGAKVVTFSEDETEVYVGRGGTSMRLP